MIQRPGPPPIPTWKPSHRLEGFRVCGEEDGEFYIMAFNEPGFYVFAAGFNTRIDAEWTAGLLNAAIGSVYIYSVNQERTAISTTC